MTDLARWYSQDSVRCPHRRAAVQRQPVNAGCPQLPPANLTLTRSWNLRLCQLP
uniref:Uncharacterized protein n=1 Tax=Macrostomum lignano TaxID=282301 RepID=A0A1I8FQ80_9PLAT